MKDLSETATKTTESAVPGTGPEVASCGSCGLVPLLGRYGGLRTRRPGKGRFQPVIAPENLTVYGDEARRAEQAEPLRLLALLAQPALDLGALRSGQSGGRIDAQAGQ